MTGSLSPYTPQWNLVPFSGGVYYLGYDPAGGNQLYFADASGSSPAGQLVPQDPLAPYLIDIGGVALAGNSLVVSGRDTAHGYELFQLAAPPAMVAGRYVFYNHSAFDGNDAAGNAADDGAIAPDKHALLTGQMATFANYSSYSRGTNGLMVDIDHLANPGSLSAADFEFRVGNDNDPTAWPAPAAPPAIIVRPGAGIGGFDRIELVWPDNAIRNQWLRVTMKPDANTGLITEDTFYFGNAVGDSGNHTADAQVTAQDELLARANPRNKLTNPAPIDFAYDYNRDGNVNAQDQLIARANKTTFESALKLIRPPAPFLDDYSSGITVNYDATQQVPNAGSTFNSSWPVLTTKRYLNYKRTSSVPAGSPAWYTKRLVAQILRREHRGPVALHRLRRNQFRPAIWSAALPRDFRRQHLRRLRHRPLRLHRRPRPRSPDGRADAG